MNLNLVPTYLKDISFRMEKVRDTEIRVVVAKLFIQPLTYEVAQLMGVESELYSRPDQPIGAIEDITLNLGEGKKTHALRLHSTVDGSVAPVFSTDDAFFGRNVKVRRDKEGPVFAATLDVCFTYPPPKDLFTLANALNQQYFIVVQPANPGLFEEADRERDRDEKERKRKAAGRETTDGAENSAPVA